MRGLADKRVVVTGAGRSVGRRIAERLCDEGARVAIVDIDADAGRAAASDIGAHFVEADVTDPEAFERAVATARDALGGLTTLVNNVGEGTLKPLKDYSPEEFDRSLRVNLVSVFNGVRAVLPVFLAGGGGVILNHASCSGVLQPPQGEGPYSAAKAGVLSLTRSVAAEYGPTVRSNAVSTGMIRTPLNVMLEEQTDMLAEALASHPLQRHVEMDEVAGAFAFLASDDASYMNGQNLVLDGGAGLPIAGMEVSVRKLEAMIRQLESQAT